MKFFKGFSIFWIIYMLFFAIGLPLIIHFAGDRDFINMVEMQRRPAFEAFLWLGIGTALWLFIFIYYIKKFLINLFIKRARANYLLHNGVKRKGVILKKQVAKYKGEYEFLLLTIAFTNLSNSEVVYKLDICDTKPYEHRFEVGKTVPLILDADVKPPYILIEAHEIKYNVSSLLMIVCGLLLLIAFSIGLLMYCYTHESYGYGWRFLHFWHPYIIIPISLIFFYGLMYGFINGIFGKFLTSSVKPYMLLYGKRADAVIESVSQTGTYINEQPQLLITVSFADDRGRTIQSTFKRVVSLLDLAHVQEGAIMPILYDPKNPEKIEYYDKD